jgi:hypothetical protein
MGVHSWLECGRAGAVPASASAPAGDWKVVMRRRRLGRLLGVRLVPGLASAQAAFRSSPDCELGLYDQPEMRTDYGHFAPFANQVFEVMHKFPSTNPLGGLETPVFTRCNGPNLTALGVHGGRYIATWDGKTPAHIGCASRIVKVAESSALEIGP